MFYIALKLVLPNQVYLPVSIAARVVWHFSEQFFIEHHHVEKLLLFLIDGR